VSNKELSSIHQEFLQSLKELPEKAAQDVLRRLRSGDDLATILNHVKMGDILLQLAVMPETRLRYVFPYRSEMPEEYIGDNPYLESLIYEAASLYSPAQRVAPAETASSSHASDLGVKEYTRCFCAASIA
jgi:hypothetical protein